MPIPLDNPAELIPRTDAGARKMIEHYNALERTMLASMAGVEKRLAELRDEIRNTDNRVDHHEIRADGYVTWKQIQFSALAGAVVIVGACWTLTTNAANKNELLVSKAAAATATEMAVLKGEVQKAQNDVFKHSQCDAKEEQPKRGRR